MRKRAFWKIAVCAVAFAAAQTLPARADEHRGEGYRPGGGRGEERHDGGFRGEGRHDLPVHAEGRHEGGFRSDGRGAERWHGHIEQFHERDIHIWRGGHWEHGHHRGRYGWWWTAGGFWYFYPTPVYPYPDPFVPPVVVVEQPAPPVAAPSAPPPPQYWYYCDAAGAYYPYVASCPSGWRAVVPSPAQ
jgi:hypothetical protein